jgi:hypothetical protein
VAWIEQLISGRLIDVLDLKRRDPYAVRRFVTPALATLAGGRRLHTCLATSRGPAAALLSGRRRDTQSRVPERVGLEVSGPALTPQNHPSDELC